MNRRDFLKTSFIWLASLTIPAVWESDFIPELDWKKWNPNWNNNIPSNNFIKYSNVNKIQDDVKLTVSNTILYWDWDKELNRSIELVWQEEINIFMNYFDIETSRDFALKVKQLQKLYWLKSDWIIWNKTLFMLYENYYIPNKSSFNSNIKKHIESRENDLVWIKNIKFEMSKYPQKRSNNWVRPKAWNFLRIIDKKIYWDKLSLNKPWTFIDKSLYWHIPHQISEKSNKIYVENYYWKKILRVYKEWNLEIACYVSPWKRSTRTPRYKRKLPGNIDMYHASGNREYRWAVMPYWVLVDWNIWIYLHWSSDIIDWRWRSHWCIRVPLFYQKKLYELVKSWVEFNIDTKNIYTSKNPNFDNMILSETLY